MMTPLKSIRAKCLDCCCGQYKEVEFCPCADCPLYPYRFGKNPNRAGIGNKGASFPKTTVSARSFQREVPSEGNYTPTAEQR